MATKSIKGITIEIAGDTTKLSKALKGVDDTSRELAGNLKKVDKLLDMDPGNAELLKEKYDALSPAVALASAKLETLKEVQDQIERQYRDGEIGQAAYLDFRKELMRTEKQLEELEDQSRETARAMVKAGDDAEPAFGKLGKSVGDLSDLLGGLDMNLGGLVAAGAKGLVGGVAAVGAALVGTVEATEEYREEMNKLHVSYSTAQLDAEAADAAYRTLFRNIGEADQSVEAAQQIALLANNTEDVVSWARLAPGVVARFGDALQPETFFESANETLNLSEATGAFVQLLEGAGVYSVEEYEKKLASLTDKEERLAYQQMGPGAIAVDQFNTKLQSLTTTEEKQAYMLEVTESLLGDAAREYETMNTTIMESRDADLKLTEATAKLGEAFSPVVTGAKNVAAEFLEGLVPAVGNTITWFGDMVDSFKEKAPEMTEAAVNATDEYLVSQGLVADGFFDLGQSFAATLLGMEQDYTRVIGEIEGKTWSIPKPRIPEISVSGELSVHPPSAPKFHVSWNAAGGIFSEPMILPAMDGSLQGFGEAGREAILPLDSFYSQLESILARRGGGGTQIVVDVNIEHFDNSSGQDPREFAWAVMDELNVQLQQKGAAFG